MSKNTYTIRNYQHSDFDNYVRFRMAAEKREPSGKLLSPPHIAEELAVPKYFPERDLFVAEMAGSIIGYVSVFLELEIGRALVEGLVHQQHRKKRVATTLCTHALQHAKNSGVKVAQINMPETNTAGKSLMSSLDFRFIRHFLELMLDIDNTHWPDVNPGEFNMRPLQPGEEDKLTGLQNRCFTGSWGFNPNTTEDIIYRLNLSGCSPEDVSMAYQGDRPVGYCWTGKILIAGPDSHENKGLIHMMGVDPEYRSQGLGKKVLLAGLTYLKCNHIGRVALTVDEENPAARGLYESVGFKESMILEWYEKKLIRYDKSHYL
jgi:mycothiol synthase